MGGFVGGHWRDDLTAEAAASADSGSPTAPRPATTASSSGAPVPAPANMPGYDFNTYAGRQAFRDQTGGYIDNSGVYAAGAGQRLGDTWSGANAGQNEVPSPTRLPIINGRPISPSNGSTGPQTGYIMYRSDPQYASLFGPGTPGYSSTTAAGARGDPTLGATAPVPGQQSLADWNTANAPAAPPPAPATSAVAPPAGMQTTMGPMIPGATPADQPGIPNPGAMTATDGQTFASQTLATQAQFNSVFGANAEHQWVQQHNAALGGQPQHPAEVAAAAQAAADDPTKGGTLVPLMAGDKMVYVPQTVYAQYQQDQNALADAKARATAFTQTNATGQLDINRMIAAGDIAYKQSIAANASATLAQTALRDAMANDIAKQTVELNKIIQQQTASYQQGQLSNQAQQTETARQGQAQTLQIEREKLGVQRQQQRGRGGHAVRFA